jgi:hypothetical protein
LLNIAGDPPVVAWRRETHRTTTGQAKDGPVIAVMVSQAALQEHHDALAHVAKAYQ